MKEENQTAETSKNNKKPSLFHKILGLKGLSMIYKILSIIIILVMFVKLGLGWYDLFQYKAETGEFNIWLGLLGSVQIIVIYLFYALLLFTVAKILKVLRKIKYAVNNK